MMLIYPPLLTLQLVFFYFFTASSSWESISYVIRINLFLAFIFFIKELSGLKLLTTLFWVAGFYIILRKLNPDSYRYLLCELPIYLLITATVFLIKKIEPRSLNNITDKPNLCYLAIVLIAAYMTKLTLIFLIPAAIVVLWLKGYKKQIFYFLTFFSFFCISWKIKSAGLMGSNIYPDLGIELWGEKALSVYQAAISKSIELKKQFLFFILSLAITYWRDKIVFLFYSIFSILYFVGLIAAYIFSFSDFEAAYVASYERYMSYVFIPIFGFASYIILFELQKIFDMEDFLSKYLPKIKYMFSLGVSALLMFCFYFRTVEPKDFLIDSYAKLKNIYDLKGKDLLTISQGGAGKEFLIMRYLAYGEARSVEGGSFGPSQDNYWRVVVEKNQFLDRLKRYGAIVVVESDDWLSDILFDLTNLNVKGLTNFAILKRENSYEMFKF